MVSGRLDVLSQQDANTCWATVATMLLRWRDNKSYEVEEVAKLAGSEYLEAFRKGQSLPGRLKDALLDALGLEAEAPQDFSITGWRDLLRQYGPLWVTTDSVGEGFSVHAILVIGLTGDDTPIGTNFHLIDPLGGVRRTRTVQAVMDGFDAIAWFDMGKNRQGSFRPQVVHVKRRTSSPPQ